MYLNFKEKKKRYAIFLTIMIQLNYLIFSLSSLYFLLLSRVFNFFYFILDFVLEKCVNYSQQTY